jgi:hypothetical protein
VKRATTSSIKAVTTRAACVDGFELNVVQQNPEYNENIGGSVVGSVFTVRKQGEDLRAVITRNQAAKRILMMQGSDLTTSLGEVLVVNSDSGLAGFMDPSTIEGSYSQVSCSVSRVDGILRCSGQDQRSVFYSCKDYPALVLAALDDPLFSTMDSCVTVALEATCVTSAVEATTTTVDGADLATATSTSAQAITTTTAEQSSTTSQVAATEVPSVGPFTLEVIAQEQGIAEGFPNLIGQKIYFLLRVRDSTSMISGLLRWGDAALLTLHGTDMVTSDGKIVVDDRAYGMSAVEGSSSNLSCSLIDDILSCQGPDQRNTIALCQRALQSRTLVFLPPDDGSFAEKYACTPVVLKAKYLN